MAIENQASTGVDAALRWVGDLDHPFYNDERQRFVWYEASAIGFQLLLVLQYALAAIVMIVGGYDALPFVLPALLPAAFTSIIVAAYASQRGAQYFPGRSDLRRSRGLLVLALLVLYIAAAIRVGFDIPNEGGSGSGFSGGFRQAIPVGLAVGIAGAVLGAWFAKKGNGDLDEED